MKIAQMKREMWLAIPNTDWRSKESFKILFHPRIR